MEVTDAQETDDRGPSSFPGTIGATVGESTPWWPPVQRSTGPNVVVIVLDDVGFSQLGCYGASIQTPHVDALAAQGLRYTNFHVTGLCSTTRASLLTGRNHHSVGVGFLSNFDTGFPGYRGAMSTQAATIPEMLRQTGYSTYASGKWHLTPPVHMSAAGPFDQWPTQRGFDRYYGFPWGEDDQWSPELWYDQHRVEVPMVEGYHLSEDLVARAKEFVADHVTSKPDNPFFLYLAFGACHAPHQAPKEYIEKYRGAFDEGWDVERERVLARQVNSGIVPRETELAPRNPGVLAWDEVSHVRRKLYARMQEVYAGFMEHTDAQIGEVVDYLSRHSLLDDTILMVLSDNGASGEGGEHGTANEYRYFLGLEDSLDDAMAAYDDLGGPLTHNHYPAGWAQAGNTPLKFYKQYTYGGGVRAPLIVHWPAGLDTTEPLRTQFHNVTDILPTITEVAKSAVPGMYRGVKQLPVHGTSMAYTFTDPHAATTRHLQYFETAGYRGIYQDGWKGVASHVRGQPFSEDHWELYNLDDDFSECRDLSAQDPVRAADMERLWWQEARLYGVLPLDDRMGARAKDIDPAMDRRRYVMLPGTRHLNSVVGPNFSRRGFLLSAAVERRGENVDGVLLAYGRRACGLTFFVKDSRPMFDFNLAGHHTVLRSETDVPFGPCQLQLRVSDSTGPTTATLSIDGLVVARTGLPQLFPGGLGGLAIQCGHNSPSPVSTEYESPFRFGAELEKVVIDLDPRQPEPVAMASDDELPGELAQQ